MDNIEPGDKRHITRVLDNAKQEVEACEGYASDAEESGNEWLTGFFREVRETHMRIAMQAEELLSGRSGEKYPAGVPTGGPAEGDPGDVSPGQNDVA